MKTMREILFRGKIESVGPLDGKWVYGGIWHKRWSNKAEICIRDGEFGFCVYKKTVGEYTGLKDKNGTKIFEGDIVRVSRGKDIDTGEIQYNKYGVWVIAYDKFYCNTFPDIFTSSDSRVWIEVIGNIHDNPELLEGATSNEAINPAKI